MLGLRREVERDQGAIGLRVGDHDQLAGPGDSIDPDAPDDLALGLLHVVVARPDDRRPPASTDAVPKASAATA